MKFLQFTEIPSHKPRKTKVIHVQGLNGGALGVISWYSHWRRYVFLPNVATLFDSNCLKDITTYIDGLMAERKT